MLDVERRIDVDPGGEQFLDILIALGVAAARRVGVGEFVDQHQLRAGARGSRRGPSRRACGPDGRSSRRGMISMAAGQRLGFGAAMRFDHADDDIDAGIAASPRPRSASHRSCRRRARRRGRSSDGRGPPARRRAAGPRDRGGSASSVTAPALALDAASSARLSASTLTCGSPRKPSSGCSTLAVDESRGPRRPASPRASATRSTWSKAASGLISGSSPEAEAVTRSAGTDRPGDVRRAAWRHRPVTRSASAWLVGPRFEPDEAVRVIALARRRRAAVEIAVDGEAWPISAEPITLPLVA